jgi:hypothetical protein
MLKADTFLTHVPTWSWSTLISGKTASDKEQATQAMGCQCLMLCGCF